MNGVFFALHSKLVIKFTRKLYIYHGNPIMVIFKFEIELVNVQFLQEEKGILFDVIVNDNSCLIKKESLLMDQYKLCICICDWVDVYVYWWSI